MVRCPQCSGVLDVDEDEVEEGEIFNCPECEAELEVVQVSPVQLNPLTEGNEDDDMEEEDEDLDDEEEGEGDLDEDLGDLDDESDENAR